MISISVELGTVERTLPNVEGFRNPAVLFRSNS